MFSALNCFSSHLYGFKLSYLWLGDMRQAKFCLWIIRFFFSHGSFLFFASPFNLLMAQNKGNNLDFDNFLLADTCWQDLIYEIVRWIWVWLICTHQKKMFPGLQIKKKKKKKKGIRRFLGFWIREIHTFIDNTSIPDVKFLNIRFLCNLIVL